MLRNFVKKAALAGALTLASAVAASAAPKIIVNEVNRNTDFGASGTEWIEYVIVSDMTPAELNSIYFGDSAGGTNGAAKNGAYKFTGMASFPGSPSVFKAGTIIVIGGNSAITEDLTYNPGGGDWDIQIRATNTTYITQSNAGFNLGASDTAWIDTAWAATGTPNTTITADGFGVLWGTQDGSGIVSVVASTAPPNASTNTLQNTSNLAGATTGSNWLSQTATKGVPNGGTNSGYIFGLRGLADSPDALLVSSINYGTISSAATKDVVVTIQNAPAASSPLVINSPGFNFGGTNPSNFSVVGSPTFPINLNAGTTTTLTIRYTPGAAASHSATATLASNDPGTVTVPTINLSGTGIAQSTAANIAAARALTPLSGSLNVKITGTVIVTAGTNSLNAGRGQFFIQDSSGTDGQSAVIIDDATNNAGQSFAAGRQLSNIEGNLSIFNGMIQLALTQPPTVGTIGTLPTPLVLNTASVASFDDVEGELVQINTALVGSGGTWSSSGGGQNYQLVSPSSSLLGGVTAIRVEDNSTLAGQPIPGGFFTVIGVLNENSLSTFPKAIWPRTAADVIYVPPTAVTNSWSLYE